MADTNIQTAMSSGVKIIRIHTGLPGSNAVPAGALLHLGDFDASSGTVPPVPVGHSTIYTISVAGTIESTHYNIGDFITYNLTNTKWDRMVGKEDVTSVNGHQGIIVLDKDDVGLNHVDNTSDLAKPISTAQATVNTATKNRKINTATNSGLKGGGDLTADRSLEIDISNTTAVTTSSSSDVLLIEDTSGVHKITRDNLLADRLKKSVYDADDSGAVDKADKVVGVDLSGNDKYYGTDADGNVGMHSLPITHDPLTSLFKKNKLAPILEGALSTLRASGGSYTDRYNFVKYSPTHNATRLEAGGLRIEGASTNLLLHSNDYSNAVWNKSGATVTSNHGIAPDGTMSSTRVVFAGDNNAINQIVTAVTGSKYTTSIWVKGTFGETIRLSSILATNVTLTGEWQRLTSSGEATTSSAQLNLNTYGGVTARTIELWESQFEKLGVASSNIPTTTAPVTRAKDIIQFIPYNNMPNITGEFTIVCSITRPKGSQYSRPFGVDKYTYFYARIYPSGNISISGVDGNSITTSDAVVDIDRPVLYAVTQSKTDLTAYVIQDGVVVSATKVRSAIATTYPNPTKFVLGNSGHAYSLPEAFFGSINDFEIYDKALSKSKLLSLAGR